MKLVIAEKPSVAQSIARVIGATIQRDGYLEGPCRSSGPAFRADRSGAETGYLVSWYWQGQSNKTEKNAVL